MLDQRLEKPEAIIALARMDHEAKYFTRCAWAARVLSPIPLT